MGVEPGIEHAVVAGVSRCDSAYVPEICRNLVVRLISPTVKTQMMVVGEGRGRPE